MLLLIKISLGKKYVILRQIKNKTYHSLPLDIVYATKNNGIAKIDRALNKTRIEISEVKIGDSYCFSSLNKNT